ncbi:hypothetical protein BGZ65_006321, partial [Modicella reniformis]
NTASDLTQKTVKTMDDISNQTQANWEDIKRKGEDLTEAYKQAGKEQVNNMVDRSVNDILNDTSTNSSSTRPQNKFQDTTTNQSVPENPSSSRWSWWKRSDGIAPKAEVENKIQMTFDEPINDDDPAADTAADVSTSERVRRPSTSMMTSMTSTDSDTMTTTEDPLLKQRGGSTKPRKILVDKAVASAAVKGHDDIINRNPLNTKNIEDTARKVHDNVVDAALPKHRQSRHEKHEIEISRQAAQSDHRDGRFVVRESEDPDTLPQRVQRKSIKKDIHHG